MHLVKNEQAVSKALAGMGHLKRICTDAFSVAGAVITRDMFIRDVRRSGDFLRGVAFWSIRSSLLGR